MTGRIILVENQSTWEWTVLCLKISCDAVGQIFGPLAYHLLWLRWAIVWPPHWNPDLQLQFGYPKIPWLSNSSSLRKRPKKDGLSYSYNMLQPTVSTHPLDDPTSCKTLEDSYNIPGFVVQSYAMCVFLNMAVSRAVVGSWAFLDYTNSHEPLNITANKIAHPATAFGYCSNRTVYGYLFLFVVELCCSFFSTWPLDPKNRWPNCKHKRNYKPLAYIFVWMNRTAVLLESIGYWFL